MYQFFLESSRIGEPGRVYLSPDAGECVVSATYHPAAGNGVTAAERMDLTLQGGRADIEAYIESVNRLLAQAAREALLPGGDWVWLGCRAENDGDEWLTRVLGGCLSTGSQGVDQRLGGMQWCRLALERDDWWDSQYYPALHKVIQGGGDSSGLVVGLTPQFNTVDLPAMAGARINVPGDLPAPALLSIDLLDPPADRPHTFVVGMTARPGACQLRTRYPASAGLPRAVAAVTAADPTSLSGAAVSLSWTGAADAEWWGFDIAAGDLRCLAGAACWPVLRLSQCLATADSERAWYRWKVYQLSGGSEYLAWESPARYMETAQELIFGPPMSLPPWPVDPSRGEEGPGLRLVLAGQSAGSGAHTLRLDFLQLVGLDGWRVYRPITGELARGLRDDGPRGSLTLLDTTGAGYAAEGPGLCLTPGVDQRLTVLPLRHDPAQKILPVQQGMIVYIGAPRRRRTL